MADYRSILLATRGGESSLPNQDRVIALALEHGARLTFLYVTDISFLARIASPVLVDIEQELDEMGAFVLAMAQERARAAGVQAGALVRRGDFRSVLEAAIDDLEVDLLVFGSPVAATGSTTLEYLQALAAELGAACGVTAMILRGGETLYEGQPGAAAGA